MKKTHIEYKYKNTVLENINFFDRYYYHSIIDLNLIKLDYILKYGIMSKKLIEKNNLINIYTHDGNNYDSKNGFDLISLSTFSKDINFCNYFESFSLHALSSPSLMISKDIKIEDNERKVYFDDEIFVKDYIKKEDIKGIILPSHLTNKHIKELCFLPNYLECYTKEYIDNLLNNIEKYFEEEIDKEDIYQSLYSLWNIINKNSSDNYWLAGILTEQKRIDKKDILDVLAEKLDLLWSKKYNIESPTYIDIINRINNNNLPLYEIGEKKLIRIKNNE